MNKNPIITAIKQTKQKIAMAINTANALGVKPYLFVLGLFLEKVFKEVYCSLANEIKIIFKK